MNPAYIRELKPHHRASIWPIVRTRYFEPVNPREKKEERKSPCS